MKLLLTSGGITNKSIAAALLDLLGKPFDQSSLAFIPTAANVEEGDKGWLIDDMKNLKDLGFKQFDIVDISALLPEQWLSKLEPADLLVFSGGNTFHLMYWLKKSGLSALLPKMLESKVYMGISAGSMVTTTSLQLSQCNRLYYENLNQAKDEAMSLVNFQVRPHLNSPDFPKVTVEYLGELAKEITDPIYALDDNSAIKVIDDQIEIVSEGKWQKFN